MPRVREIEEDGGEPILKKAFAKERALFGDLLNTTKVMAHCPPILRAVQALAPRSDNQVCCRMGLCRWFRCASPRSTAARSESTSIPSV